MTTMSPELQVPDHAQRIAEQGWTVIPDAIEADLLDELADDLSRLEVELDIKPARNSFEGSKTLRVYNLLVHGGPWLKVPVHPNVLPVVEAVLDPGCLVSSLSSINIGPGETPQPLHADDQLLPIPRPHPPTVCNTMWALTDFTDANGATRLVPRSHLDPELPAYGVDLPTIAAEMARGSVLVWPGSLWHGGGANRTNQRRIGIAMNYCAGYIRQQENQQLGIPSSMVRGFPPRLQELVGYGLYNGLVGHIDKKSPLDLLNSDDSTNLIWDALGE